MTLEERIRELESQVEAAAKERAELTEVLLSIRDVMVLQDARLNKLDCWIKALKRVELADIVRHGKWT